MNNIYQENLKASALSSGNAAYIEELYEDYLNDRHSVSEAWQRYFDQIKGDAEHEQARLTVQERFAILAQMPKVALAAGGDSTAQMAVLNLVNSYRNLGHLAADLDPLALKKPCVVPELSLEYHGLSTSHLEETFVREQGAAPEKLKDIIENLKNTYTHHVGVELAHLNSSEERAWLVDRLERAQGAEMNAERKKALLERLVAANGMEKYLHQRYVGQKRFSLEGGDSMIPSLNEMIQRLGAKGTKEIVISMAHRGRLNVLVNVLGKAGKLLFDEFEGRVEKIPGLMGDVKYHMGFSSDLKTPGGDVHLALAYNPSHLEFVNPVEQGSARARLERHRDGAACLSERFGTVVPIQIHGDAAVANQGVIQETTQLARTRHFTVGGTLHIIINNQIGFTISHHADRRSSVYASDPFKIIQAPIFHVNADDPEAVLWVSEIMVDYLLKFKKDSVLDLIGYRRLGHNEADEPALTQPLMYQAVRQHPTPDEVYAEKLQAEKVIDADTLKTLREDYRQRFEAGEVVAPNVTAPFDLSLRDEWAAYTQEDWQKAVDTRFDHNRLLELGRQIFTLPAGFEVHKVLNRVLEDRLKMMNGEHLLDWGAAENLAYATLLDEGYAVRLSGEDSGRGTFSHRHAVWHHSSTGEAYIALQHLKNPQPRVEIVDSILSECGVLGFEYGFSTSAPNWLNLWEGQFGDFANGGQVMIDQFITSGESKWNRSSGLVMLLPHGMEGQGPEHSSARIERYLQLCAANNIQVCIPTTPAQCFHMLRRQMHRSFRKPLVVFSPKSLLRHKEAVSSLQALSQGSFQEILPETDDIQAANVKRIILCAGKVYYDLRNQRRENEQNNIAILRVEQLYPFPVAALRAQLERYPNVEDIVWCQEEGRNQGAWRQIYEWMQPAFAHILPRYVGRPEMASPASGYAAVSAAEQKALIEEALKF